MTANSPRKAGINEQINIQISIRATRDFVLEFDGARLEGDDRDHPWPVGVLRPELPSIRHVREIAARSTPLSQIHNGREIPAHPIPPLRPVIAASDASVESVECCHIPRCGDYARENLTRFETSSLSCPTSDHLCRCTAQNDIGSPRRVSTSRRVS